MAVSVDQKQAVGESEAAGDILAELIDVHGKLDSLWEQYLEVLDEYQKAQSELQKNMSSGFFSLAQANFKSPNRRRYGQDFFDERMKATKRCQFETNGGDVSFSVQYQAGDEIQSTTNDDMSASSLANREPAQQPSPPASPEPDETSMDVKTPSEPVNDSNEKVQHGETQVKSPADPIRWFGILVPRELRSTQTSFSAAIDVTLAKAVNAAREMREIDTEIRKLRKTLRKIEKKTAVE